MELNNTGDSIAIWDSFESYERDHENLLNMIVNKQLWLCLYFDITGFADLKREPDVGRPVPRVVCAM